jgi:hypothetical protein
MCSRKGGPAILTPQAGKGNPYIIAITYYYFVHHLLILKIPHFFI